jgi:hypothetical protein
MPGPGRRFQKGNPGGPGRPPKKYEEAFLDTIKATLTPKELKKLLKSLLHRGTSWGGDRAAGLLLKLLFGDKALLPKLDGAEEEESDERTDRRAVAGGACGAGKPGPADGAAELGVGGVGEVPPATPATEARPADPRE